MVVLQSLQWTSVLIFFSANSRKYINEKRLRMIAIYLKVFQSIIYYSIIRLSGVELF